MREEEVRRRKRVGERERVQSEAPCLSVLRMYCAVGKCHLLCLSYNSHRQRHTWISVRRNIKQQKPFVHAALNRSYSTVRFSCPPSDLQLFPSSPSV